MGSHPPDDHEIARKIASEVLDKNGSMTVEQCYNSIRIELWMTKGFNWTILK